MLGPKAGGVLSQVDNRRTAMQKPTRAFFFLSASVIVIAFAIANSGKASSANPVAPAQDAMMLDRRISTLEQRLYSFESRLNQVQQQVQYSQRPSAVSGAPDPETERLRLEVSLLQARLADIECSVIKLDERTLPATARAAQPKTNDACRLQPNTPVLLPAHRQ
jgi:uncharacterized protein YceH (UPF0502 family)